MGRIQGLGGTTKKANAHHIKIVHRFPYIFILLLTLIYICKTTSLITGLVECENYPVSCEDRNQGDKQVIISQVVWITTKTPPPPLSCYLSFSVWNDWKKWKWLNCKGRHRKGRFMVVSEACSAIFSPIPSLKWDTPDSSEFLTKEN